MKRLNINKVVSFRLTHVGATILNDYWRPIYEKMNCEKEYKAGDIYKAQLWEVMQIFGPHISMGNIPPCYNCGIYLEDADLVECESIEQYEKKESEER